MSYLSIAIFLLLLLCNGANARTKVLSSENRKLEIVQRKTGVDSLTASRISAIEKRYKTAVSDLMAKGGLSEKDLRQKIDALITVKNADLGKLLPRTILFCYLPVSEAVRLDPASAAQFRAMAAPSSKSGKVQQDQLRQGKMSEREKGVQQIVAAYEDKLRRLKNAKGSGAGDVEIKKLESERDQKLRLFLSAAEKSNK